MSWEFGEPSMENSPSRMCPYNFLKRSRRIKY
jgi:hypothetical protein